MKLMQVIKEGKASFQPSLSLKARVFEFYFNPEEKTDLIFDSFCYDPENIYQKKKGSLYLIGLLKNVLPQNIKLLNNLANLIKEKYYHPIIKTPEKSLKESLRKTNEFLENIAKKGDVSWLGNLSFAALSLSPLKNNEKELNFTKVGNLKIFLLRGGQIIDIDQKLKFQEIEPYPLKIFSNIISGKLIENDIILLLNQEVADTFFQENILTKIAQMNVFEQKKLNKIFNAKKEALLKISGICLLIVLSEEDKSSSSSFDSARVTKESFTKEKQIFLRKKRLKVFSLKSVFLNIFPKNFWKQSIKKLRILLIKIPRRRELRSLLHLRPPERSEAKRKVKKRLLSLRPPERDVKHRTKGKEGMEVSSSYFVRALCLKLPKFAMKRPKIEKHWSSLNPKTKKKIILILLLLLFLLLGFLIFN